MNDTIFKYGLLFLGLILLQVLILNNICFLGFINPLFYIYFVLILPASINRDVTLLLGFLLGLFVDIFSGTLGCHTFATTLLAYMKPIVHKLFGPRNDYDDICPSIQTFGTDSFMRYASTLVIVHHLAFFLLETFTFEGFFGTLLNTICCSLFTLLLVFIVEQLTDNR